MGAPTATSAAGRPTPMPATLATEVDWFAVGLWLGSDDADDGDFG